VKLHAAIVEQGETQRCNNILAEYMLGRLSERMRPEDAFTDRKCEK
jgi:hypothetical protein